MSKNLFDGLSPLAAFATKLFTAAGLDLAALQQAGDVNALKAHLEKASAQSPDLAAAITQATEKLTADLGAVQAKLDQSAKDLAAVQEGRALVAKNHAALVSTLDGFGITIADAAFNAEKPDETAAALKSAINAGVAKSARVMVTKAGLPALPEDFGKDPVTQKKEKSKDELSAERDALSAADLLRRDFNAQLRALNGHAN